MKEVTQTLRQQVLILGSIVAVLWAVTIVNTYLFHGQLNTLGIVPHQTIGLRGVLFAPFLHANFKHLISNTLPLVVLGWLVMLWETSDLLVVSLISMFVGGMGTWLFGGANTVHVGASGVIFGYLGYLLLRGYFERSVPALLMSLFIGISYGSTVLAGVLPGAPGISWQGHLFGFLGGVLTAKLASSRRTF
jgi:membrane associated rhomboid family serine protease